MTRIKTATGILFLILSMSAAVPAMAAPNNDTAANEYAVISDDDPVMQQSEETAEPEIRVIRPESDTINTAEEADAKEADTDTEAAEDTQTQSTGSIGTQVVEFAKQFLGGRYHYGGSSLTNGTDCSGFTMSVYRNFGIALPHSSAAQRAVGTAIGSLEQAEAGDIICYSGHVALYIGNGQIIHALNASRGIVISNARYSRILAIRRVL